MPCRLNRSHLGDKILFKGLQLASLSLDTSPGICDPKRHLTDAGSMPMYNATKSSEAIQKGGSLGDDSILICKD